MPRPSLFEAVPTKERTPDPASHRLNEFQVYYPCDQAIEFPLPDAEGRRKLVRLYAGGLRLTEKTVEYIVRKTKNGSAAFMKELMRRSAQFLLESGEDCLSERHIDCALDEMLFSGGVLNAKLLGIQFKGPN